MTSFMTANELQAVAFNRVGNDVQINRKASIYGASEISIGSNTRIDDFCILSVKIVIGDHVHIAAYTGLFGGNLGIELKNYSGISSRCAIYAERDDYSENSMTNPTIPDQFRIIQSGRVSLEENTLVGSGCTILPGVTIGNGTSVGSMSLVNKSLDSCRIYAGVPCRRIKEYSQKLLDLQGQDENEYGQGVSHAAKSQSCSRNSLCHAIYLTLSERRCVA